MNLSKKIFRSFLYQWAQIGIAPGYLHQIVDQYANQLHSHNLKRSIRGQSIIDCDLRDHVQSRIYFFGAYEPIEAYLFCQLIKPGMTIIDAGANIGFYSLLASSYLGEKGKVFAFEPVPANYKKLESNIEQSQKKNIEVIKMGLWHKLDTLTFSLSDDMQDNQGSFTASETNSSGEKFSCPVVTLDQLVAEERIPQVDLIKMDIEGAELFALQGAQNTIEKYQPSFLMEINQEACDAFSYPSQAIDELLLPLGYKIFRVSSLPENSGFVESTKDISRANVFFLNQEDQKRFLKNWNYKEIKKYFS